MLYEGQRRHSDVERATFRAARACRPLNAERARPSGQLVGNSAVRANGPVQVSSQRSSTSE